MESGAFREVIEKAQPAYTMPSRKHLCTKLIPERCANIHQKMKLKFQEAPGVCLTIDLWSSRDMRSFIAITAHFIENFTLMSVLLTCRRVYGSHTGECIYQQYDQIVTEYDIHNKITAVITDSAANMVC